MNQRAKIKTNTIFVLGIWTLLVGASLAWNAKEQRAEAKRLAIIEAKVIINKDLAFRLWATMHGGVYVKPTEKTPPNPYLIHIPDRDVETTTGKQLTLMNPAYILRQAMAMFSEKYGVKGHITSLQLLNPNNAPDAWEKKALQSFQQGAKEAYEITEIDGTPHMRMMLPMYMEKGCLKCHAATGVKVGEIRGGISTAVPLAPYEVAATRGINLMMATHGSIWLVGLVAIGFISKRAALREEERSRAEEQISTLNRELEQRVRERTAQLESVNKELEAFAYSVSHDLRAPLRSIDGFSQALLEDYNAQVDQTGQDYLRRVRAASQRMAQLIDDMLQLSRLTRGEMSVEPVDLSAMAGEIVAELKQGEPERQVEIVIAPDAQVKGDPRLLRAVMENLLGNAWKYTGKHSAARIEFGVTEREGSRAYFVRDDGAGFDMQYVGKLFAPFQRLHAMEEFPGNGIGLATVQRIIRRHGGEVWAEGEVEHGATFTFTLGL